MAKAQEVDETTEDDGEPRPGAWARLKSGYSRHVAQGLDRVIAALQRLRLKVMPDDVGAAAGAAEAKPAAAVKARIGRPFLVFLIALTMLLTGVICGAMFSFRLFAQRIESQGELIARQADDVYEYGKDARHAELALEQSKAQLKEAQQALAENQAELQQTRLRMSEAEGKILLYGNKGAAPQAAVAAPDASTEAAQASAVRAQTLLQAAGGKPQVHVAEGSCHLGSGNASLDLSRCLKANAH